MSDLGNKPEPGWPFDLCININNSFFEIIECIPCMNYKPADSKILEVEFGAGGNERTFRTGSERKSIFLNVNCAELELIAAVGIVKTVINIGNCPCIEQVYWCIKKIKILTEKRAFFLKEDRPAVE